MLRVFVAAPLAPDRANPWVRHAADGGVVARGSDVPERWPADAELEVVLAANLVRLAALDLPAMPRNRLRQAARFALEDQMATPADEAAIAVARPDPLQPAVAAIASAALIRSLASHRRPIARIVPESALAPRGEGWTWCASAGGGGFVRRADGSAFAVGASDDDGLPAELAAALGQALRAGQAPAVVHAAVASDAGPLDAWSRVTGVQFVAAPHWHWERASAAAFAAAPDFIERDASAIASGGPRGMRPFRPALVLAALAIACLALGALAQWTWLAVADWRLSRALVREATDAGLAGVTTPQTAAAAIARRHAELRHRAGRSAPADAWPLLARAAPSMSLLPSGALRSATYANDAWTLELSALDAETLSRVTRALGSAGVDAVSAPTAGGARMRLTLDPAAR